MSEAARTEQAPAPTAAPTAAPVATPTQSSTPNAASPAPTSLKSWRESLPEDLRNEPSIKNYQEIPDLVKGFISAQRMVGADKIAIPGKYSTEQDWKDVYTKLGLPESVDKYELPKIENANEELLGNFKKVAHESGILPQQAAKILDFYQNINKQASESNTAAQKAAVDAGFKSLEKEWGAAYDREMTVATRGLENFADPQTVQAIRESGISQDPNFIRLMNRVGKTLAEDKIRGDGAGPMGISPAEASTRINQIMSDSKHPYRDASHPGHGAAVEEVRKLFDMKNVGQ